MWSNNCAWATILHCFFHRSRLIQAGVHNPPFRLNWHSYVQVYTLSECSLEIRKLMCTIFQPVDAIRVVLFHCFICLRVCLFAHMLVRCNQLNFNCCLPFKQSCSSFIPWHIATLQFDEWVGVCVCVYVAYSQIAIYIMFVVLIAPNSDKKCVYHF